MNKLLALIPARGGSKGIPRKNLARVGGHPLVAFAIAAAQGAGIFADIVVSTDDAEIAASARHYGGEVPFLRRAGLAEDQTPMIDVVRDVLDGLSAMGRTYEWVCLLQPTTPYRNPQTIGLAFQKLQARPECTSCVGVTPIIDAHPRRLRRINGEFLGAYLGAGGDNERQQRQDHADDLAYRRCGAFYFFRAAMAMAEQTLYGPRSLPFIVEGAAAVTLDEPLDLLLVRAMWEQAGQWPEVAIMQKLLAPMGEQA